MNMKLLIILFLRISNYRFSYICETSLIFLSKIGIMVFAK